MGLDEPQLIFFAARSSVENKKSQGGASPKEVEKQIQFWKKQLG